MSSLTPTEQLYVEKILNMGDGYVLNFNDAEFGRFFKRHGISIHSDQYQTYGTSKAKKMRAFWERDSDSVVGRVLSEMLDNYEAQCELGGRERNLPTLEKSREIVARLCGKHLKAHSSTSDEFLNREFEIPNVQKLPVEFAVSEIIQNRLWEAQECLLRRAYLSSIIQCGSVLEAVLLGAAQKEPEKFNRSQSSPKRDGKVKAFQEWSLSEFIDVAHDIGVLKPDVQKFSHGLRHFRNYIHPYQQLVSDFAPDEYTAKVCFQVIKAALADVAGVR